MRNRCELDEEKEQEQEQEQRMNTQAHTHDDVLAFDILSHRLSIDVI